MQPTESSLPVAAVLKFVAVWLGGSILILGAILVPIVPGGWFTVAAVVAVSMVPLFLLLRGLGGAFYPSARIRLFIFRPFWYAMLCLPLLAIVTLLGTVLGFPFGIGRAAGYWTAGGATVLLAGAAVAGYLGSRSLIIKTLTVRLPDLPRSFDGVRIVQISDLHVGPQTPPRFLARVTAAVRDSTPDMIVVTGDQVDDFYQDVEYFNAAFGELDAPLGVFAVAGNHDVYAGWDAVRKGLSEIGMTVLVNEALPVQRDGETLWVAGTGDPAGLQWNRGGGHNAVPDVEETLRSIPHGAPSLVLAHNPVLWPALAEREVSLTLSGHTHYGQLAIPRWRWNIAGLFIHPSMGSHQVDQSLLYINPGTNFWGLPFRVGTPPEVTVHVLSCCADGEEASIDFESERAQR